MKSARLKLNEYIANPTMSLVASTNTQDALKMFCARYPALEQWRLLVDAIFYAKLPLSIENYPSYLHKRDKQGWLRNALRTILYSSEFFIGW